MSISNDIEGLNKLKDASIWLTVITLISTIGILYNSAAILSIVSLILLFIKGIPSLRDTFNSFSASGKEVSRGIGGLKYLPIGYILLFIAGIFLILDTISVLSINLVGSILFSIIGILLLIVGIIVIFISYLFIGLTLYDIGNFFSNDLIKIGGILSIIPVIDFVGWILIYLGADDAIRNINRNQTYVASYQPIYQTGNGILRFDGSAFFSIYSLVQGVQINSAILQEIGLNSLDIQPKILIHGTNNIFIKFPEISNIIPPRLYTIVLNLSNGQIVVVKVNLIQG
ncbi:DUF973 family protein [Acidianus manzaensis]|uniref:DUF973 domain-containing protein n=1 Tax=Acidianus manzaensis TaxID=282676 RepID=A0A1W6JZ48_9CREN|nr:DUF973 family protein [Acidianus manzaensis]ARM75490.1 hypothetical protein B6F84_05220 [Acidianus manzaensis]